VLLTNASAQVALKTLRVANASLEGTQQRISTGLKVQSAKDNAAFFLVSNTQRSDVTVQDGIRENLLYALGAVQAAQSARPTIDQSLLNIKNAIVALETGTGEAQLEEVIRSQIDEIKKVLRGTSFNGINLLERENLETMIIGASRNGSTGSYDFQTLTLRGQGLGLKTPPVSATIPPFPGTVMNYNSQLIHGSPGQLNPTLPPNTVGVNIGTNGSGGVSQRTFAISFETGSDITTQQIIYEEGGNVRGLNISIRNGSLVFGGYNLPTGDPGVQWPYREVTAAVEPNTRYTAQLVLDGDISATGEFRAYVNGALIDTASGVGILYDHPGGIGIGRINGNAVLSGTVQNYSAATEFQGAIDKVLAYNQTFNALAFDQVNTYLAEGWLPTGGIQYYIGSPERRAQATLIELLDALLPLDQAGFSTVAALEVLDAAQAKVNTAFAEIGFIEGRLQRQQDYLYNLSGSMEEGIAALVEADLAEESAKLQAYQVQTQLAQQSLVIANQRPTSLLRLFN
jgi:flagellin-like hook-associated protein FlgL